MYFKLKVIYLEKYKHSNKKFQTKYTKNIDWRRIHLSRVHV